MRDFSTAPAGRLCMHRKKINTSTVLAGQRLGIKEVDEGIWLVSLMHYDLGYIVTAVFRPPPARSYVVRTER